MAYVAGFGHDIFLSYAHVDDLRGWIQQFHDELEIKLAQRFGRIGAVTMWRDTRLAGNQIFDATIQEALERSAVFIAITSMGYLQSEYCQQELAEFHRKATLERYGTAIGDRSRIINVLLYNIPPQQWPKHYGRTSGIPFHSARTGQLGKPHDPKEKPFDDQLYELTEAIHALLQAFTAESRAAARAVNRDRVEESSGGDAATAAPPAASSRSAPVIGAPIDADEQALTIYVADVTDTMRTVQRQIMRSLARRGFRVKSGIPPPYEATAHETSLVEMLQGVDVSVHLLDRLPGRPVDGLPEASYPGLQLERALDHSPASVVWHDRDHAGGHPAAPYVSTLRRLERSRSVLVSGPRDDIAADVIGAVERIRQARQGMAAARTVLVDFHSKDYAHAVRVHDSLEQHGLIVLTGPDADDPRRNLELFEQRLRQAGTMVIPMGSVSDAWVRERVNSALQVIAAADCPTRKIIVHVVPPRVAAIEGPPLGSVDVKWVAAGAPDRPDGIMTELLKEVGIAQL